MLFISTKIFTSCSKDFFCLFGHVEKQLDLKKVNFQIHDVRTWLINNCDTHINQYLEK